MHGGTLALSVVAVVAMCCVTQAVAPPARAVPAPEVEYLYNVGFRRHLNFPNGDALGYGYGICDKIGQGNTYAQLADAVRVDLATGDEYEISYVISNAVGILCPAKIWQLRSSAAHYRPSGG